VLCRFDEKTPTWKIVVFQCSDDHSDSMPTPETPWPHAPTHQLSESGTYFVTAGTYLKDHHFRTTATTRGFGARSSKSYARLLLGA
jgi:hypothetical protein